MEIDNETMELICRLEEIVGNSCYNPNSYNGWTREYGKSFRYPIRADMSKPTDKEQDIYETRYRLYDVPPENINRIFYKFGSNELSIGGALKRILEFLEKRYGISVNELESEYKQQLYPELVKDFIGQLSGLEVYYGKDYKCKPRKNGEYIFEACSSGRRKNIITVWCNGNGSVRIVGIGKYAQRKLFDRNDFNSEQLLADLKQAYLLTQG